MSWFRIRWDHPKALDDADGDDCAMMIDDDDDEDAQWWWWCFRALEVCLALDLKAGCEFHEGIIGHIRIREEDQSLWVHTLQTTFSDPPFMFPWKSAAHWGLPLFSDHFLWSLPLCFHGNQLLTEDCLFSNFLLNPPLCYHVNQLLVEDHLISDHFLSNLPLCFHINQLLTKDCPSFQTTFSETPFMFPCKSTAHERPPLFKPHFLKPPFMFPCKSTAHGRLPLFSNHVSWNHPLCFHVNQMLTGTTLLFRPLWLVTVIVAVLKEGFHCITFLHELRLQWVWKLAHCSREIWQNVALPVFGWFCCCCFLFVCLFSLLYGQFFHLYWWTVALLAL